MFIGYANHMIDMIKANAIEKAEWKSWAPNLKQAGLVSAEGVAVPVQSSTPGIAYNTNGSRAKTFRPSSWTC